MFRQDRFFFLQPSDELRVLVNSSCLLYVDVKIDR